MPAELVFSGGHRVRVSASNAEGLAVTLNRPKQGQEIRSARGSILPPGWIEIETDSEGVILVNPATVAYVSDADKQQPVMDLAD
jgi:hypothetical protein